MAVSKSWSTDVAIHPRRRCFTLEEANRSLPLVRRIVSDIMRVHEQATQLHALLKDRTSSSVRAEVEDRLSATVELMRDYADELKSIGCELKDYRTGVVEYLSKFRGREVILCWVSGDEQVLQWRELHDDGRARQSVRLLKIVENMPLTHS